MCTAHVVAAPEGLLDLDFDPRDRERDDDIYDIEAPWVDFSRLQEIDRERDDVRDRDEDDRDREARERVLFEPLKRISRRPSGRHS